MYNVLEKFFHHLSFLEWWDQCWTIFDLKFLHYVNYFLNKHLIILESLNALNGAEKLMQDWHSLRRPRGLALSFHANRNIPNIRFKFVFEGFIHRAEFILSKIWYINVKVILIAFSQLGLQWTCFRLDVFVWDCWSRI